MFVYLFFGITYALAAAIQPGPFQTFIISKTLETGWKKTLPAAFAPGTQRRTNNSACAFYPLQDTTGADKISSDRRGTATPLSSLQFVQFFP